MRTYVDFITSKKRADNVNNETMSTYSSCVWGMIGMPMDIKLKFID